MIRSHVVDPAALSARTPSDLSAYLRATGWVVVKRTDALAFWERDVDGGVAEILQPLDPALRDYASRIGDAVVTLAAVEDRVELDILRRISGSGSDVHTVSLFPADEEPGMLPLDDAVSAYDGLRGLVSSSAYSVFARQGRAVQPSRKPHGMAEFLRSVRVGPAEEGSYILTVHLPVPPRLSTQPSLFDDAEVEEPVSRQVSMRMHAAVRAAQEAADGALLTDDGLDRFTTAVNEGVSANLCEALTALGGAGEHPFEMSVALAAARPGHAVLAPVRFRRDHLPVLRAAAAELRARTPEENVTVTGEVVRLHREGSSTGEITLIGRIDDSETLRRIWTNLPEGDYAIAMQAHRDMRQVTLRGNLVRRGTRYYLTGSSGFQVLDAAD